MTGMPKIWLLTLPICFSTGGTSKIGLPSLTKIDKPRAMVSIASVIMNEGMPT